MKKIALLLSTLFLASCGVPPTSSTGISKAPGYTFTSQGAPGSDLGVLGDTYLDEATGKIYVKTGLGWQEVGNLPSASNPAQTSQNQGNSSENQGQTTSEQGQEPIATSTPAAQTSDAPIATSNPPAQTSTSPAQTSTSPAQTSQQQQTSTSTSVITSFDPVDGFTWDISPTLYGEQFMVTLGTKLAATQTATASYSGCLNIGARAAAYPNENSSTFIPFYHEAKDSEKTTTSGCNREHTWPNSRGGGDKAGGEEIERDPIMVRPTITEDNSDRGNNVYGTGSGAWDPASIGYEGARGESARVILYVMARYGKSHNLILNNSTTYTKGVRNMGILKTLLEWNRKYKPTEFEKTVCNRYYKMGYARNAFVDHPEFADYIWDDNGFRTTPYNAPVTPTSSQQVTSATTQQDTSTPITGNTLEQIKNAAEISGKDIAIVANDPNGGYVAMSDEHKVSQTSGDLPWYLIGDTVSISGTTVSKSDDFKKFRFTQNNDQTYTITIGGKDLYGYIDGTHYSIQLGAPSVSDKTNKWSLSMDSNGGVTLYSEPSSGNKVYLIYSDKASFCGTSSAASGNIRLFA